MSSHFELNKICVSLGGRRIVSDISFHAHSGEFIGLIGPNGAGKSTLLKAAACLIPDETGDLKINGDALASMTPVNRARHLAYLPQARPIFWSVSARAIVSLGRFAYGNPMSDDAHDVAAIDHALSQTGAAHLSNRPAGELSGGELARVHLARMLASEAPVMLADEPIAALDPAHQLAIMALLRQRADAGACVIAALHELPLAVRYCTRLLVMQDGTCVADGAPEKILSEKLLRDVFGVASQLQINDDGIDIRLMPLDD